MTDRNIALKFGKILKKQRKEAGLTQEKLAQSAGLTPEHIQRLEGRNPSGVRLQTIVNLSKAFNLKVSELLKNL